MSGRDHSEQCPKCGIWCGGLDNSPCNCDPIPTASGEGGSTSALRASAPEGLSAAADQVLKLARHHQCYGAFIYALSAEWSASLQRDHGLSKKVADMAAFVPGAGWPPPAASVEAGPSRGADAPLAPEGIDDYARQAPPLPGLRSAAATVAYELRCIAKYNPRVGHSQVKVYAAFLEAMDRWLRAGQHHDDTQAQARTPSAASAASAPEVQAAVDEAVKHETVAWMRTVDDLRAQANARIADLEATIAHERQQHAEASEKHAAEYHRIATALGCHVHDDLAAKAAQSRGANAPSSPEALNARLLACGWERPVLYGDKFTWWDDGNPHGFVYLVCPGGLMVPFGSCEGDIDLQRVLFIRDACNAVLGAKPAQSGAAAPSAPEGQQTEWDYHDPNVPPDCVLRCDRKWVRPQPAPESISDAMLDRAVAAYLRATSSDTFDLTLRERIAEALIAAITLLKETR